MYSSADSVGKFCLVAFRDNFDTKMFKQYAPTEKGLTLNFNRYKTCVGNYLEKGDADNKKDSYGVTMITADGFERIMQNKCEFPKMKKTLTDVGASEDEFVGIAEIRFIPELNIINLITKDFKFAEQVFNGAKLSYDVSDDFVSLVKSAYLMRIFEFYRVYGNFYLKNCKTGMGTGSNSLVSMEYKRLRQMNSFVPVGVMFTDRVNFLTLKNSETGKSVLDLLLELFPERKGFLDEKETVSAIIDLETTNINRRVINVDNYEGVAEAGKILFATKKDVAENLAIKTDFVDFTVWTLLLASATFGGFFGVEDKLLITAKQNGDEVRLSFNSYALQYLQGICIEATDRVEHDFCEDLAQQYFSDYENFLATIVDPRSDVRVDSFGGNVLYKELSDSKETVINKFELFLIGKV
jgi:hypothetical protein